MERNPSRKKGAMRSTITVADSHFILKYLTCTIAEILHYSLALIGKKFECKSHQRLLIIADRDDIT